jgi:glycerate dehydrogenase
MKIVVLDGYAMNPGDLCWEAINSLGSCDIYDRTSANEIVQRSIDADIIVLNKVAINGSTLKQLPKLKYICVTATGYNIVDTMAARKLNINVANVPAYCAASVAQMVFAHILNLSLRVCEHAETVKNNKWRDSLDFTYWIYTLQELSNLTIGLIGFGSIARAVSKIANSFDMKVITYKPSHSADIPEYVKMMETVEEVFELSDIISLHCPLVPGTEKLVNKKTIDLMKKSAYLINTGRGGLIDEPVLAEALNNEKIAGAGLDVLSTEPPQRNNPLISAKNCYITPHIAWATVAARKRLMDIIVDNIASFIKGSPKNIVN